MNPLVKQWFTLVVTCAGAGGSGLGLLNARPHHNLNDFQAVQVKLLTAENGDAAAAAMRA
jgi:hypothetical protein